MSNRNENSGKPKSEKDGDNMSILESIRKRTGLLVGIVGLALVIFILESLLGQGRSLFGGGDEMTVGKINGKKIDRNEFAMKFENQLNIVKQQRQSQDIDDNTRGQVIDYVWQQYVADLVIKPQYNKIGITVGEDEIYDRMVVNPMPFILQNISDQKTGQINPQFAKADGTLDPNKWKQAIAGIQGEQEAVLAQWHEGITQSRMAEKYASLVRKGLYVTNAEAKAKMVEQAAKANVSFVVKTFNSVSDSAVKITDDEISKYYKENSHEFLNPETTRKIEFVSFNVTPTEKDLAEIQKTAQNVADKLKGKSLKEDSMIIGQESENGVITVQDYTKKTMVVRDSSIYTSPVGTVFGPYNEGAYFKVYKLVGVNSVHDSARVRHILLSTQADPQGQQPPKRTMAQAKRQADSLITLIKEKKVTFDTLVKTISDDPGSISKGGDYGWFNETIGFVEPFKNAGLMGVKGNISAVETQFGIHIIEVLDVSASNHNSYKLAQVFKLISPSDETNQMVFAKASEFAGKNNTGELFDKGVDAEKLTKRIADNVKEGDRQLVGLDKAKDIVRWAYSAKKGEVSVFTLTDKHVVAKLANIKNKGILALEDVKEEVRTKAIAQKKAEMFLQEFKNAGSNPEQIAAKLGLEVKKQEGLNLASHNIDGLGHDDIMMGTISGLKAGSTSKAIAGDNGVFVVSVSTKDAGTPNSDLKMAKMQIEQEIGGRADYEAFNALKDLSDVEQHTSKID